MKPVEAVIRMFDPAFHVRKRVTSACLAARTVDIEPRRARHQGGPSPLATNRRPVSLRCPTSATISANRRHGSACQKRWESKPSDIIEARCADSCAPIVAGCPPRQTANLSAGVKGAGAKRVSVERHPRKDGRSLFRCRNRGSAIPTGYRRIPFRPGCCAGADPGLPHR
jgi:hypothetical protein